MTLEDVILCSGGLRVAQRGARPPLHGPALTVSGIAPIRLPDAAPVEARRADNVVWRRHWLEEERLAIEFVGLAAVEVDEASGSVTFDRHLPREMEQHLLLDHVLPLVLARRGRLVVHGGVVSRHGRGAVLIGASGAGKSTLTAFAWQQGWTVGGDDGAVLYDTDPPVVEPTYATVRLTPGSAELLGIVPETSSAVVGKRRITGDGDRAFRQQRVEVGLIAIIEPAAAGQPARFQQLDGGEAHARLFGSTFHAELSGTGLLPGVIDRLASIVEASTVGRLTVPHGIEGLAAAERLLRANL
ncbi:MAG TPA: hypothetical protein VGR26_12070 [Acidimicrobiales bacterium]|nr:hypothetical protein [Acidimicrobiales bacterium]